MSLIIVLCCACHPGAWNPCLFTAFPISCYVFRKFPMLSDLLATIDVDKYGNMMKDQEP